MGKAQREAGIKGEYFFIKKLNEEGVSYEYLDDWVDFEVEGQLVEVKSALLMISQAKGRNRYWRVGRFDFHNADWIKRAKKKKVWVCLLLRHGAEFLFLGFFKAQELKKRFLPITKIRDLQLLTLKEWLGVIERK